MHARCLLLAIAALGVADALRLPSMRTITRPTSATRSRIPFMNDVPPPEDEVAASELKGESIVTGDINPYVAEYEAERRRKAAEPPNKIIGFAVIFAILGFGGFCMNYAFSPAGLALFQ